MKKTNGFSLAGIIVGCVCLGLVYLIGVYGPSSYSASSSAALMADGSIVIVSSKESLLPKIVQIAFVSFLVPFIFGVIGVFRKEKAALSLASLVLGLSPIFLYTIGVLLTSWIVFSVIIFVSAFVVFNKSKRKR